MFAGHVAQFDWAEELHKTVVKSLSTSFGLDFLLLEDKKGGDVDTFHNVRKHQGGEADIHRSEDFKRAYEARGEYKDIKSQYHSDSRYIKRGEKDKKHLKNGDLYDEYRGHNMGPSEKKERQLDHIVSANEIHEDAGRVLAEIDGVELAGKSSNLQSTHAYINRLKSKHSVKKFVNEVVPNRIETAKQTINNNKEKLEFMPSSTPQERHEKREMKNKIRTEEERVQVLESIDKDGMIQSDKAARKVYDAELNKKYYTSSKFLKNTAFASANTGLRMGTREALGLVFAEVWFELRAQVPEIYKKCKDKFDIEKFIAYISVSLENIWERVQRRFKDIITAFKDGTLSGVLSSITTTILNIFLTTEKLIGRLIREMWNSLVNAAKLIFFNPERLTPGGLAREVTRILSTAVSVFMGVVLNQHLMSIMSFPFGTEIAAFLSALVTGIMTVCISYFLDHSELMKKVWDFLDKYKGEYKRTLEYFQKVNSELDRYLLELSKVEFNMRSEDIKVFADGLLLANSEYERGLALSAEVAKRNIELPFEIGNTESTRSWLIGLGQKKS